MRHILCLLMTTITACASLEHPCYYITMKHNNQQPKKPRGGQPGNQNARKHGNYSRVITPREMEVLEAVSSLDDHGKRMVFFILCRRFIPEYVPEIESRA